MKNRWLAIKVKRRAKFTCEECSSTENVQAHDLKNGDGICLCGYCHSKRHPNVSSAFIISKKVKAIWRNVSVASIARRHSVSSFTVVRRAKRLGIPLSGFLGSGDAERLDTSLLPTSRQPKLPTNRRPRNVKDTVKTSAVFTGSSEGHPNGLFVGRSLPHPSGLYVPSGGNWG